MITFIGAGPGAADLITVRGQKRLEQADIVIYAGSLVNPALLDDPHDRPLPQWWWHLGKLRAGTYPAELLPPHLQAMYRQGQRQAA